MTRAVNAELVHGFHGSLLIIRPPVDDADADRDHGVDTDGSEAVAPVGSPS